MEIFLFHSFPFISTHFRPYLHFRSYLHIRLTVARGRPNSPPPRGPAPGLSLKGEGGPKGPGYKDTFVGIMGQTDFKTVPRNLIISRPVPRTGACGIPSATERPGFKRREANFSIRAKPSCCVPSSPGPKRWVRFGFKVKCGQIRHLRVSGLYGAVPEGDLGNCNKVISLALIDIEHHYASVAVPNWTCQFRRRACGVTFIYGTRVLN